jgi:regulatory protein
VKTKPGASPAEAREVRRAKRIAAAEADERTVRTAAYALLAGRDFSRHELTERLLSKGYGATVVEESVRNLVAEGLLREERYAGLFVAQRAGRGHGPVRIRMDLRERGVDPELVEQALAATEVDWVRTARDTRRRKFGVSPPGDFHERAKQARFLQYRGFSSDQIRAALGPGEDDLDYDH